MYLGIIPRWTRVLLRRIIRRVIFHVNAQRERHPRGRRRRALAELSGWAICTPTTDVSQEFFVPDKRRNHDPPRVRPVVERPSSIESYRWLSPRIRGGDICRREYEDRLPNAATRVDGPFTREAWLAGNIYIENIKWWIHRLILIYYRFFMDEALKRILKYW